MQKKVNKNQLKKLFLLAQRREGAESFNFQYLLRLCVSASKVIRAVAEFPNGI
jgi:hypothetical protein